MIYLLLIIGFLIRVLNLNQSFWLDEAAQLIESARPLSQQLNISGDFWPPLFHLLLHFWLGFGHSEIVVRLFPVLLGVGSVWMLYLLAKNIANKRVALIAAGFLSVSPFHVWYSQEVRPYMLAVFLGMFVTFFLIKKNWLAYFIAGVLFLYTSYLALFLLITHGIYVCLFERKTWSSWFKATIGIGFFFLPWLPAFGQQLHIGTSLTQTLPGWSEAVSTPIFKALPLTFVKFILGRITFSNKFFYGGLVTILFGLCSVLLIKGYKKEALLIKKISLLCFFPIFSSFLVAFFLPIYAPQRVLFSLPFFYLLLAIGIESLSKYKRLMLGLILLISSYSLHLYYTNPQFQREQWREAVVYVETTGTPKTYVIFVFSDAFAPWQWYSHTLIPSLSLAPTFTVKETELNQFADQIKLADRIYFFHYLTELTDPGNLSIKFLNRLGFSESNIKDFPGVGFISIYEKSVASN